MEASKVVGVRSFKGKDGTPFVVLSYVRKYGSLEKGAIGEKSGELFLGASECALMFPGVSSDGLLGRSLKVEYDERGRLSGAELLPK